MSRPHLTDSLLLQKLLELVTTVRYDREGRFIAAEFKGGYRVTLERVEPSRPSSLPPATFETTATPVDPAAPGPSLAKCLPSNVVPFRRREVA